MTVKGLVGGALTRSRTPPEFGVNTETMRRRLDGTELQVLQEAERRVGGRQRRPDNGCRVQSVGSNQITTEGVCECVCGGVGEARHQSPCRSWREREKTS